MLSGMLALRNHCSEVISLIEILMQESDLPCFEKFDMAVFRERFKESSSDAEVIELLLMIRLKVMCLNL